MPGPLTGSPKSSGETNPYPICGRRFSSWQGLPSCSLLSPAEWRGGGNSRSRLFSEHIFGYYLPVAIKEIHVSGYRSVREVRLKLRQINVLTGPNASGKSNLYNSVFLLAKTAGGGFAQVIAEEGGMPSVLWAGARRSRSLGSSRLEPARMRLGVKTEVFNYEMVCGL